MENELAIINMKTKSTILALSSSNYFDLLRLAKEFKPALLEGYQIILFDRFGNEKEIKGTWKKARRA